MVPCRRSSNFFPGGTQPCPQGRQIVILQESVVRINTVPLDRAGCVLRIVLRHPELQQESSGVPLDEGAKPQGGRMPQQELELVDVGINHPAILSSHMQNRCRCHTVVSHDHVLLLNVSFRLPPGPLWDYGCSNTMHAWHK